MLNGRRQPSRGGTSRMTRECQVRFCERLGVKFPGPTRPISGITALHPWRLLLLNQQTLRQRSREIGPADHEGALAQQPVPVSQACRRNWRGRQWFSPGLMV